MSHTHTNPLRPIWHNKYHVSRVLSLFPKGAGNNDDTREDTVGSTCRDPTLYTSLTATLKICFK